jgi:heptosyltransferase-2
MPARQGLPEPDFSHHHLRNCNAAIGRSRQKDMKFLIIRLGAIGDIVLATPVVRCLKKQVPGADVHFLADPKYKEVIQNNPFIDKIHTVIDSGTTLRELEGEQFNSVIDLQGNAFSKKIKRTLNAFAATYDPLHFETAVFTRLKWNIMPKVHLVDRYLKALEHFGVQNDGAGLDYVIAPHEEVRQHDIPASHQAGYIALVIGASFYTKKLPVYKLQDLCAAIPHPVMLLGGKEEYSNGEEIKKVDDVKIYNACGKFSLNESADLVRKAKLVIAHDTGLMHIAAAFKKPVIVIWGSTTPSLGMVPYYGQNFLMQRAVPYDEVQVHKLWCRPCTSVGRQQCPQGHFRCMKKIPVEEIVQKIMARLRLL